MGLIPDVSDATLILLTGQHVCQILDVSSGTWRGWVSKGMAPPNDGNLGVRTPFWKLTTIIEYVRNAPGGRLGYPVG
jgi:hypothetical protein